MKSWSRSPIRDVVEPVRSWDPLGAGVDKFVYVDLSAVDQEHKRIVGAREVRGSEAPSRARQLIAANDILVSTVRPNLNAVARVPQELDGATASTGFCVLRPKDDRIDPGFLFHWVRGPTFVREMTRRATGANYPAVSDRIVLESEIPLPPLCEQRRIAAILDEAEALRSKRKEVLAKLEALAQSLFVDMFGDPVHNPRGWPRVPFRELLDAIESGRSPVCLDRPARSGEWGVLKLGAVTSCEYDPSENKALPEDTAPAAELEVRDGDLLFTRKNTYELVAAVALVHETPPRLLLPDLIFRFRLRPSAAIQPAFLHRLLISPTKRGEIQRLAGGSAGSMPNISKSKLESVMIELPPVDLQKKFSRRMAVIEALKKANRTGLDLAEKLFASLQHRAFRGEL
jgi:type I restriction enzyme S subunit